MRRVFVVILLGVLGLVLAGGAAAQNDFDPPRGELVFLSQRTGGAEIWTVAFDGADPGSAELMQLTDRPHTDWAPTWSPDGMRIAFHAKDPDSSNWDIWAMDPDGGNLVNLTNSDPVLDMLPGWSPDGEWIVFVSNRDDFASDNRDIYIMRADGGDMQRLTDAPGHDIDPTWSPDGERIAFASEREGTFDIYVLDIESGDITLLYQGDGKDTAPAWSPDGEYIVFTGETDGNRDIYRVPSAGGSAEALFISAGFDASPEYSPNGAWIAFYSNFADESNYDIYVMDADGTDNPDDLFRVTDAEEWDTVPHWRPVPAQ